MQEEFQRVTVGNETTWDTNQTHLIVERTNENEYQTFLTISNAGGHVQVICGLAKLPTKFQMAEDTQIIACFAPRWTEVPTTMFLVYEESIQRSEIIVPTIVQIQEALAKFPQTRLVQTTSNMKKNGPTHAGAKTSSMG